MKVSRFLLALFFVVAGANHFVSPKIYLSIMPAYFPWPAQLVALSGAAEMAGGLGILFPQTRKLAGWGLIALLVAVFPANIQALSSGMVIAAVDSLHQGEVPVETPEMKVAYQGPVNTQFWRD